MTDDRRWPKLPRTMTAELLTTVRELDPRVSDGIEVRLRWCGHDQRASVAVSDAKTGQAFSVIVRERERALDVFHHPFAYAAWHGLDLPRPDAAAWSPLAA